MRKQFRSAMLCTLLLACAACLMAADETPYLQQLLTAAKPGQTVTLPAGEFRGGVTVPAGVSLKGAGYGRTIIDAGGAPNGLTVTGGSGTVISDCTVRGAAVADVLLSGTRDATVRRLRVTGGLIGISVQGSSGVRLENAISDDNRYGIIVNGGAGNTVVNCSVVGNTSMGLSLPAGKAMVAFNNLVTESAVAVNVGQEDDLTLDNNLYLGVSIGKCSKRAEPRETMNDWQFVSGLDAHSVSMPVQFENAAAARYAVVNVLEWSPDRTVSSRWGAASLAGRTAPRQDIDGVKRPGTPGVGAFETTAPTPRAADGTFEVPIGNGLTSAGVFDAKGKLVTYLFQTLPLPAGKHAFWLPARSYIGQPIAPGSYEVRVVKGDLTWKYLGWYGNTEHKDPMGYGAPCSHAGIAFDGDGHFFIGNVPSDTFKNLRAADAKTGQWLWTLWGTGDMPGATLTMGGDGLLYIMRNMGGQGMCVTRLQPATGTVVMDGTEGGQIILKDGAKFTGLAALGDTLCYTDTANNAVRFGTVRSPVPTTTVAVTAPKYPAADAKTGVVWVISGEKLVAVSPDGKVVVEVQPVPAPVALAARDGLLAVASAKTGKVHLFDAANPAALKELRTLGRGDGPDGRVLSDRFFFQDNPGMGVDLALGPHGELAVADFWRIQVFESDGTLRWSSWGIWGGGSYASHTTPGRVFDGFGFTYQLDGTKGTWQPESYHRVLASNVIGDCRIAGQTFVQLWGPGWKETLVRFTPEQATPVLAIESTGQVGALQLRRDTNGDGRIDEHDTTEPVLDKDGKPLPSMQPFHHMYNTVLPDGTLLSCQCFPPGSWLSKWTCAGLDAKGVPIYRWQDRAGLPGANKFISPFSWKLDTMGVGQLEPRPGGGWYVCTNITSSPQYGKSVFNNGGTDVLGVDQEGKVDWVHPFPSLLHIGGFASGNGLCLAAHALTHDFHILNRDGLEVPGFSSQSADLDHPQAAESFVDQAGQINVLITDCTKSCNDWYCLTKCDIRATSTPVMVKPPTTTLLAGLLAAPPDFTAGKAPAYVFHVPHLKAPLPMDGDLQKWRGITPQLILTPEIGGYRIDGGARDCSVIVRLAWEGRNLYMQAFKFDNVVTSHNPQQRAYLQDTIEMAINSCLQGMKFNFSLTSDLGQTIYADGGMGAEYHCTILSPEHAPRVIKVLDNAKAVSERQLLENIAGIDMSDCKVEYFEAKLPIDKDTYAGREGALWELKPGNDFRLGFLIDDNDQPGADTMRFIQWPLGYGYFMPKDNGAQGILDE